MSIHRSFSIYLDRSLIFVQNPFCCCNMDNMWYDISCAELCEAIAICLRTTMYECKIKDASLDGRTFFTMDENDWFLFFGTIGVRSFQHMRLLKMWFSECKDQEEIVKEAPQLSPMELKQAHKVMPIRTIMARSKASEALTTTTDTESDWCNFVKDPKCSGPASKVTSLSDSSQGRSEKVSNSHHVYSKDHLQFLLYALTLFSSQKCYAHIPASCGRGFIQHRMKYSQHQEKLKGAPSSKQSTRTLTNLT